MPLSAPLDDAACVFRAQQYAENYTAIPNEGTRTEPLVLGPSVASESHDPVFVADATLGDHLRFIPANDSHAVAGVPPATLNGDVTFAIRYRPEQLWADRLMLSVVESDGTTKRFMLHQTSGNKYMARFWEHPSHGWAQLGVTSTTSANLDRTDTIVVTWNAAAKQVAIHVNGVQEAIYGTGKPRADATQSGLQVPFPFTSLKPSCKLFSIGQWSRCLSPAEILTLQTNADWLAGGSSPPPPPPPPPPGVLRVFVDGVERPSGTTVAIDGVLVDPPTGPADKIVEVESP